MKKYLLFISLLIKTLLLAKLNAAVTIAISDVGGGFKDITFTFSSGNGIYTNGSGSGGNTGIYWATGSGSEIVFAATQQTNTLTGASTLSFDRLFGAASSNSYWTGFAITSGDSFTITGAGVLTLRVNSNNTIPPSTINSFADGSGTGHTGAGNADLVPIPENSTYALYLSGALFLGLTIYRRLVAQRAFTL